MRPAKNSILLFGGRNYTKKSDKSAGRDSKAAALRQVAQRISYFHEASKRRPKYLH